MLDIVAVADIVAALTWDPQIRGFLIFLTAFAILPGSVYLLLSTNLGARVGFLIAVAGLTGWMAVMSIVWMVYGIGMKGRTPHWKIEEVRTGDVQEIPADAMDDFPQGWKRLAPGDRILGDAQAAADKALTPATEGEGDHGAADAGPEEPLRFEPVFDEVDDYIQVAGYHKGGDNELFTIGRHKFYFRHSPHYAVVQVRPVLEIASEGGAPRTPEPDPRQPVTTVVMLRDLGSIRFPPFVMFLSNFVIFAVVCSVLHRRDKQIQAMRASPATG